MGDQEFDDASEPDSGKWVTNRRVLLKAAAGVAAFAAAGGIAASALPATAQSAGETKAKDWFEADEVGGLSASALAKGQIVAAEFTFFAVGAHWPASVGTWPAVELSFSEDGKNFSSPITVYASVEERGISPTGRYFTGLVFTSGTTHIRYRTLDGNGNATPVPGFALTYIDATNGPNPISPASLPTLKKPTVISRAGWGADNSLRFDQWGEIWPKEYQLVEHAIIHHTDTFNGYGNGPGAAAEVRSIYYYHAVTQEWGDIGYNYLVDHYGNVYEGRVGGENVVGGHAFQYAYGSSGIGTLGNFAVQDITSSCQAAIVAIVAWATRNRDPLGRKDFHEAPNLPTISSHRNVNQSTCPGDFLYADLPAIRQSVANVLASTDSPADLSVPPFPSDVRFHTGDCVATHSIYLRWGPDLNSEKVGYCPAGTLGAVAGLPRKVNGVNWYYILTDIGPGNVMDQYLDPAPIGNPPAAKFQKGDTVRTTDYVNVRRSPGLPNRVIGYYPAGTVLEVSTNSVAATGYRWYGVYNNALAGGWVVQNYLQDITPPSVTLSRTRGIVNIWITANVNHFPHNAKVYIQWDGETKTSVVTNSLGDASVPLKVPYDTKGFHTIRAVCPSFAKSDTVQYEVVPRIKLIPTSGKRGDTIQVSLRGYAKKENVRIRWQNGSSFSDLKTVLTSNTGSVNTNVTVPKTSPSTAKVRGDGPIGRAQTTFTITVTSSAEKPTETPTPEQTPTEVPTQEASPTQAATQEPTQAPTEVPTQAPTDVPTQAPTDTPAPTETPTAAATETPTP
ncbi:MAG: N-acetylmuramoyl-L-alanine amidase [Thermomicrobiales bacterium]